MYYEFIILFASYFPRIRQTHKSYRYALFFQRKLFKDHKKRSKQLSVKQDSSITLIFFYAAISRKSPKGQLWDYTSIQKSRQLEWTCVNVRTNIGDMLFSNTDLRTYKIALQSIQLLIKLSSLIPKDEKYISLPKREDHFSILSPLQGFSWYKLLKKVWKSEFDRLFLSSLSKNRCTFGTIGKIIYFSLKWYPTCYWLCHRGKGSILKYGIRSQVKSCKMNTSGHV